MDCSFLVLFSVVAVSCLNDRNNHKLDISLKSNNVGVKYYEREFDNVFYSYYKPKYGNFLRYVSDKDDKIWSPLDPNENCKYALVAYRDQTPYLLYLLLVGPDGLTDKFYRRELKEWEHVNPTEYNNYLKSIKDEVKNRYVSMYLRTADHSPYYNIYNVSDRRNYKFISVKKGLSCFLVLYKKMIWLSANKEDRCVAVWAYKVDKSEDYNLVRLLVSHPDGSSELLTYKYDGKLWQKYNESNKPGVPDPKYADNLIHPEYDFVDKRSGVYFPPSEIKDKDEIIVHNEDPEILYIDPIVLNHHVRRNHEYLDDVNYYHYYPKSDSVVSTVFFSSQKVWTSYLSETLRYALVVHDDYGPSMVYLLLNFGENTYSLYLRYDGTNWVKTDSFFYKNKVKELKYENKVFKSQKLDLKRHFADQIYDVSFGGDYVYYTPKYANRITSITHNFNKVWSAGNEGDRCLALWSYVHNTDIYMLKLLVTSGKETDVLLYYYMNGGFLKVDYIDVNTNNDKVTQYFIKVGKNSYRITKDHANLALKPLEDFYYPDYEISPKYGELDYTYPLEKYQPLFDLKKLYTESSSSDYMKTFITPIYTSEDYVSLDLSQSFIDNTVSTFSKAVFDGSLMVGYFEPVPGKYFSDISENGVKIFSRRFPSEACIGFTIYIYENQMLGDVLLANFRPASVHLHKYKGKWRYVSKERFDYLLENLKNANKPRKKSV